MAIDLLEETEANRPAKSHPIGADQLEVIPPGALIDDAGAEVHVCVTVFEHEPQLGQRAGDFSGHPFCARPIDLPEISHHAMIA
jgi:hypothetical protein